MSSLTTTRMRERVALAGVAFLLVLLGIYLTRAYLMDDALITLRYSFNLARHGRAIWNQADAAHPTLGYTTVLWMLLNALPALVTDHKDLLVLGCKLIALGPLVGIVLLVVGRVESMPVSFGFRLAIVAALFSQVLYGFHLNSGMETLLFSFLAVLAVCSYVREDRLPLPYAVAALAFLTRPEGALVAGLMLWWDLRRGRTRQAAAGCALLLVVALTLGAVLYSTYGTVLPNAFYVKQQCASLEGLKQTARFYLTLALPFVPLAAYSAYRLGDRGARCCWQVALLFSAYFLTVRPLMNTFSRYQWPVLLLLTYASLPALQALATSTPARKRLAVGALLVIALVNGRSVVAARQLSGVCGAEIANLTSLGKVMAEHREAGRWLAYCGVGAICYYSDWDTYDTMGLNTRAIALRSITPMDVYRSAKTDLVLLNWGEDPDVMSRRECGELGAQLGVMGYRYLGSVPIVPGSGPHTWQVALFARDPVRADALLQDLPDWLPVSTAPLTPAVDTGRRIAAAK